MKIWSKKKKFLPRVVILGMIAVIITMLMSGFMKVGSRRDEVNQLNKDILKIKNDIAQTEDILAANDDEFIEKFAREKLGFGYPNEEFYIDITGK